MFCRATSESTLKCAIKKEHSSKTQAKAHPNSKSGPSTNAGIAQAQLEAHSPRAVARHAAQGAAAPLVRPHHPQHRLAPPSIGGSINAPRGRLHGCFPKIHEQTDLLKLYKKTPSSHSSSTHNKRARREEELHSYLGFS